MILAVPKYGRVKANKILTQCRISPSKTIGGLSERQRAELVQFAAPLDALPARIRHAPAEFGCAVAWRGEGLRDHRARPGSARER